MAGDPQIDSSSTAKVLAVPNSAWLQHLRAAAWAYGEDYPLSCKGLPSPTVAPDQAAPQSNPRSTSTTPPQREVFQRARQQAAADRPTKLIKPSAPAQPPGALSSPTAVTQPPSVQPERPLSANLAALRSTIGECQDCKLCAGRTQIVFGDGSPTAAVMFIGEAPGYHEDQRGLPFVGAAGQLLDRIIEKAMGLSRADVYIANVNKCRPPENRDPEPDEVAACLPFLREQIRLIAPRVIVTLGRVAAQNLLSTNRPMRLMRGRDLNYDGIPVVATWHPAYLLRSPASKMETWTDIKRVNRLLGRPEVPQAGH